MKKGKREIFQTNKLSFQIPSIEKLIGYTRNLSHAYLFIFLWIPLDASSGITWVAFTNIWHRYTITKQEYSLNVYNYTPSNDLLFRVSLNSWLWEVSNGVSHHRKDHRKWV